MGVCPPHPKLLRLASLADNRPMSAVLQARVAADRKSFYEKIDKAHVTPLWEVLHSIITPTPNTPCKPYLWKWDQMWPWIQEAGPHQRTGSRTTRTRAGEPGAAGPVEHHTQPLCRAAAHPSGRGRAGAPPLAVGAALHPAWTGRLHRRGRREGHHE